MEILLASLALIWGNVTAANPDASFEQLVQASLDAKNAVAIVQPDPIPRNGSTRTCQQTGSAEGCSRR